MRYTKIALAVTTLFPLIAQATNSQVDPGAAISGALQQQLEKQLPNINTLPVPGPSRPIGKPNAAESSQIKVLVKGFRFEGVTRLDESLLQEALKPWIDQSVTIDELQKAADIVAEVYRRNNILAQATLPPQKIGTDGIILITVVEAKLGAVRIDSEKENPRFSKQKVEQYITYANPIGTVVNTSAIERAIYILNETPGVAVNTSIEAGDKEGEAALRVNVADTPLIAGKTDVTNFGSRSTGILQGLGTLILNNPNGFGDQLSVNGIVSEGSQYGQVTYSFPLSPNGLRLSLSSSYMNYRTIGDFSGVEGDSTTVGMNLSYPILRSQTTNINTTVGFDQKIYANKNTATDADTSRYQVKNLTAGVSGNHYDDLWGGGINNLSLTLTRGQVNVNDSTPTYGVNNGKTFVKLNTSLSRNQQLIIDSTVLTISFSGQVASTNLDSVEKFYLGGPSGVRAYPTSQGAGDLGGMINIEVQQQLPERFIGYAFFDAGMVQQYKDPNVYQTELQNSMASNVYHLAGYGVGVRQSYKGVNLNASVAWRLGGNPLYRNVNGSYVQQNNDGTTKSPYIWLQASYPF